MYFPFVRYRKIFYTFSALLVLASVLSIAFFGLKFGIDFTGGSSLEVFYESNPPSVETVRSAVKQVEGIDEITVHRIGETGIILKTKALNEQTHEKVLSKLRELGKIREGSESFQTVGPVIGRELRGKTKIVVLVSLLAILIYIALSFRRVSRPVKSYIYGLSGIIALFHDILIPLGVFSVLGRFYGVEITIPVITAFLTVFGYSINDSVVVFDRVRENLLKWKAPTFDLIVEKSLNETLVRSLNTSLTTIFVLLAIFLFGGETLRYFSLALILGIGFGTYSSLFLASPLLTTYYNLKKR